MDHNGEKHQRRIRYKGTHPKKYQEKYKELQPENTKIQLKRSFTREARRRHASLHLR